MKTPLTTHEVGLSTYLMDAGGHLVAMRVGRDDALRIAACVNACDGIATDILVHGGRMIEQIATILHDRDEARRDVDAVIGALERLCDAVARDPAAVDERVIAARGFIDAIRRATALGAALRDERKAAQRADRRSGVDRRLTPRPGADRRQGDRRRAKRAPDASGAAADIRDAYEQTEQLAACTDLNHHLEP